LNWLRPNTQRDFSYPVSLCNKPIISHETCQFQIYPDYRELKKYTGVLYPYNLETFRSRLEENGLTQQIDEFHNATGKWAVECYKADMEYCRRTRGFGGYQLLDIKDYPGQGSALCGILDAFMETKGLVEPEVFRGWNAPVVPLALIPSYCFTTDDTLSAEIAVSNFTEDSYPAVVEWNIETVSSKGKPSKRIAEGVFEKIIEQGALDTAGNIFLPLASVGESTQIRIVLKCGEYQNSYNLWVYADTPVELSPAVMVADTLSKEVEEALLAGRRVLLVPNHKSIENQSIEGLFTPDYWNYAMFKTISENGNKPVSPGTLGMLMDPVHPMFASFPTEGHTNWQWWCIALNSRPLILDPLNKNYFPIIQTVDNVERNHKLGILMEMRVGNGSLLICTTDLNGIGQFPEGRAYADAIRRYVSGNDFNPAFAIDMQQLRNLLYSKTEERDIQGVQNLTDYNK
ncbi:MAG: glycoside hydrolase, partial [Bacteroidales bacterium]|nr:glycoside hydrolase [Bacteroidales bacterium]